MSLINHTLFSTRNPSPSTRHKTLIILGAAVVAVAYGMARFALGLSTPRIIEEHVATEAQIGYASSLSFLTYVIACFMSSSWLKHQKWRLSIIAVLICAVTGCLIIASAQSAPLFIAGVGIAGAAAGFASGAVAYRLVRELPQAYEPRGQAVANAGTGIGVAVSTLALLITSNWRIVYILAAVLATLFCLWFCFHKTQRKQENTVDSDFSETRGSWEALIIPITLTILMGAGSSVYWTYGRSVAETQTGLSEVQSMLFWGLIGVAGVAGSFSGDAVSRYGTEISWATCSVILGASIVMLPFAGHIVVALVSGALFGTFYTVMCGLTIELGREAWADAVGSATSILFATIAVGQTLGSLLIGVFVAGIGLPVLFIAGGVLVLVGAVLVWRKSKKESA
ncbi:MFS transporter [Rothia nasisuis]|uniref:MFS transporter n=1 Tax=Rothia nasisuis TaxID=2109647 RepID=UPI001F32A4F5|nr:MFS transporter [Rothia nasisuis]